MIRVFNHYFHVWTLRRILFDVGLALFALAAVMIVQGGQIGGATLAGTQVLSLAAGMFVINIIAGLYQRSGQRSIGESCLRAGVALVLALTLTYQVFALLPTDLANSAAVRVSAMLVISMVIVRRVFVGHWTGQARTGNRVLIFGAGPAAQMVGATLKNADPLAKIVGYFPGPNEKQSTVSEAERLSAERSLTETARAHGVDEIVVALTERRSGSMPMRELLDCKLAGVRVFDITTYFERMLGQIRIDYVNAGWLIFGDGFNQGFYRTAVKRIFDILCSLVLIIVSAPVMLLTAIAIKLESRGPVFYRQERVGANSRVFKVTKFRSMCTDAEKDGKPVWATKQDSRVTRIGNIIRKTRIDELPQLFNVLKGEMSLVGPRPERPYFVEQLTQEIPYYAVRHSIKPGVTGWAQVKYQYGSTVEDSAEKLQYDLYYVKNHSLFLDFVILFETVGVVLTGKGAR
ncbi:TIGR03013 family XrtA/PEP-CTERM system glycosyltransferase [Aquabacterium humicola]|uniref:TIGR03013 family XrtA/PEP-CTERM system glycosyltransferase n=1 Tax=Aquabacterium humicola TaxID=3237377 RepID=UPI002542A121|nr:TIGR03013 family XrtA/PEP-CTERM system glycosyltransferase [Rubrivivax pictus]